MADLTNYNFDIPRPQEGAVRPMRTTTVLGAAMDGASNLVDAVDRKMYNDSVDSNARKQEGLDKIAIGLFGADQKANANIPQAARNTVSTLDSTKAGVDQGVLPQSAYQVQLQNLTSQVMSSHPESAYEIMNFMKASGHYSSMFKQLEDQQDAQKNDTNAELKGRASQIDYYYANGGTPGTDPDTAQTSGQKLMLAHAQQQQAQYGAQAAREQESLNLQKATFMRAEADRVGMQGIQGEISARVTPIFESVQSTINSAPLSQQDKMRENIVPLLDNMASSAKTSAIQHMIKMGIATPENIKIISDELDQQVGGIKTIFSDKSGQMEQTLKNLHTQYGIDTAKAAPVISRLSAILGPNQVATLLGPQSMLDPELQKQLGAEWKQVTSGVDGQIHLNNIVSILRGNTNLKDYSQKDAAKYIGGVVSGKLSSENAIINGGATNVDHSVYLNTNANILNAVHSLTPASDGQDLVNASNLIATQKSRLALDTMSKDPATKEQAEAVGMASHAASLKLLQDFNQGSEQSTFGGLPVGNKAQKITFDNNAGVYKVTFDPTAYPDLSPQSLARLKAAPVFSGLQKRVDAMNQVLDHAVKTSKYDTDLPSNASPLDLRRAYANNTPVQGPNKKDGEVTPEQRWQKSELYLEDTLRKFPNTVISQDRGLQ